MEDFILVLIRYWQSWCFIGKLLKQKIGTLLKYRWYSYTYVGPDGVQRAPDRSGPQAPVTKQSSQWPFGEAILAVAKDF